MPEKLIVTDCVKKFDVLSLNAVLRPTFGKVFFSCPLHIFMAWLLYLTEVDKH